MFYTYRLYAVTNADFGFGESKAKLMSVTDIGYSYVGDNFFIITADHQNAEKSHQHDVHCNLIMVHLIANTKKRSQ